MLSGPYFRKSKSDAKITISERGVSLHSGAVNMLFDNYGKPKYVLVGYEEGDDALLVKPVEEDEKRDAFKIGGRVEEDKYLTINSKSLSRYLKRTIDGYDDLIEKGGNNTIPCYAEWDDERERIIARLEREKGSNKNKSQKNPKL